MTTVELQIGAADRNSRALAETLTQKTLHSECPPGSLLPAIRRPDRQAGLDRDRLKGEMKDAQCGFHA